MQTDLDQLMTARGFDALLVTGSTHQNPAMFYLANGVHVGAATILVKKRGRAPVIIANSMERDEAARSGLRVIDQNKYRLLDLTRETGGDRLQAQALFFGRIFADLKVKGVVAVYGWRDQGEALQLWPAVARANPQVRLTGEYGEVMLDQATATKDAAEVKRIRAVARATVNVVGGTQEFLQSHRARAGYLVKKDGARLTIGDVKRRIRELLLRENVEIPEGLIFALGRDAGVPHSQGNNRAPIALGRTIVYDIFPQEPGGGYFYDFTRTWCVGFAPPEVERAYQDVLDAYNLARRSLKANEPCRPYQQQVCDLFESRGHATTRSDPETTQGYVHSLGHGLGLRIHETPTFRDVEGNTDRLLPGTVVTLEPGLYYPDLPGKRAFGVRLEDTVWLNPKTLRFETLAEYPKELVISVKG